jgi:hypothetical protein
MPTGISVSGDGAKSRCANSLVEKQNLRPSPTPGQQAGFYKGCQTAMRERMGIGVKAALHRSAEIRISLRLYILLQSTCAGRYSEAALGACSL